MRFHVNGFYLASCKVVLGAACLIGLAVVPAIGAAQTNFGSVNVGSASATVAVTVTLQNPGKLGSIAVLTKGAPNLDFTDAGGDTCTVDTTYGEGQTCTVHVAFKPEYPGPRYGAVELLTGSDAVLATAYVQGTGVGPLATFANSTTGQELPGQQSLLLSGQSLELWAVAVDGSGNIFFSNYSSASGGTVNELLAAGGYTTVEQVGSGFTGIDGLSVDGGGNVFVLDTTDASTGAASLKEVLAAGGYTTVLTLASGFKNPGGVAVDGYGNVFVSDSGNGEIKEVPEAGGYTAVNPVATGLGRTGSIAIDGSGDIFFTGNIASTSSGLIAEIVAVNGKIPGSPTITTFAADLDEPVGLAVDASGNVFFTAYNNAGTNINLLDEIVAVDGNIPSAPYIVNLDTADSPGPPPIALDGKGDIFYTVSPEFEGTPTKLYMLEYGAPPSLSFASTDVGSTSSAQEVIVGNAGNAPLTLALPTTGDNPEISGNFVYASNSSCTQTTPGSSTAYTLGESARCTMYLEFAPQAGGALTGSAVLTDNSLNVAGATQTISLSGTGLDTPVVSLSATSLSYGSVVEGTTSAAQQVTLTNTGTGPLTISSIAVTGTNASAFPFTNTCGTSVAVGASCTIMGDFAPAATGAQTAAVTITDNAGNSPQSIALSGTGITGPVTLSAYSLSFGSVTVGYPTASQYVVVTNSGTAVLTITSIAVTGTNASSFDFANTCGASLAVGANCTIHGHFDPTTAGALTAAITITDSASTSPQTITLSGTGVPLPVTLSYSSLTFASTYVGESSGSEAVTVTNTGSAALSITGIALTGADPTSFVFANNCGTSLAVGANCTIHGHFAPTTTGALTAAITITDSATTSPQTVTLSGTGLPPPVTLSATSLSFGLEYVGETSASQTVVVTNNAASALSITSIVVGGANASSFDFENSCAPSLPSGATCTIHGHFAPATVGAFTATIALTDSAVTSPQTITLSGTGINPVASLSATSLAYGSIAENTPADGQTVTLTNTGTSALNITSIAVTGTNASEFDFANDCGTSLAAGSSCTIHGHFAPTALGAASAAVTITDNALNSPQSVALTGTGVAATSGVTLSATSLPAGSTPTNLGFGSVVVGSTSSSDTVILTNTGTAALTITSIAVTGGNASQFAFSSTCGTSLAVGATCLIQGHFGPTVAGAATASVTITDSDPTSPQTIALSGTGLAASGAVTLSATSLAYPATTAGTASGSESVTMTNTGAGALAITSITVGGNDPSSFVIADSCGTSLAAGASCTIHGHFAPVTTGAQTATVTIVDSAAGSPQTIALSGTGQ